ncbi:hypothetical protein K1T35_47435 (plasmid) [Pseudonocardia sp. DSM 110487]|uniref:hypothetical protein n=1 Tax=Pseudonocardia sp. DSM 110487 TaxID=2865833 RepID=UPI001C69D1BA|nr:hypothetical protein [Pseudonocardia sp. DSM 110487]QYN40983.1 hypothetical protein K1T35_47435 [Pseudonocardia sp. DSM 110487]
MGIQFYALDRAATGDAVLPEAGFDRQVDVSVGRIRLVFGALDIDSADPYNDDPNWVSAFDMICRVDRYLAAHPEKDPGSDDQVDWHPRRATWIQGGRRPGYLDEKLEELRTLAERCAQHGWDVAWA